MGYGRSVGAAFDDLHFVDAVFRERGARKVGGFVCEVETNDLMYLCVSQPVYRSADPHVCGYTYIYLLGLPDHPSRPQPKPAPNSQ